jgi:hypothetical protein
MLMKKLSEEHYIVMGDSEIKVGDIVAEKLLTGKYELFTIHTLNDIDRQTQKKITHSTQPESLGMGWMQSVQPLFLSEVKELLGEVDVEEKADLWSIDINEVHPADSYIAKKGYMKGYKESLEDNKERKYTEEDMRKAYYQGHKSGLGSDNGLTFEHTIQSLQPKTEWEVEMVEGKLKLKS